jgi:excisionase family DNA binding protein
VSAAPTVTLDAIIDALADRFVDRVAQKLEARPMPHSSRRELLTVKETAERIGRTPGAVYQLIARGELPAIRRGRRVHVRLRDIEKWIEEGAA